MILERVRRISTIKLLLAAILAAQLVMILLLWQAFGGTSRRATTARDGAGTENAAVHAGSVAAPAQAQDRTPAIFLDDATARFLVMQREIDNLFNAAFAGDTSPGFPFRIVNGEMFPVGAQPPRENSGHSRTARNIEEVFDELLPAEFFPLRADSPRMPVLAPAMDMRETRDSYVVTMSLPGMSASNISVSIEDRLLTVNGRQDGTNTAWRFQKRVLLPGPVVAGAAEALVTNGLLKVTTPKAKESDIESGIM